MTEDATGRELDAIYNVGLAQQLLALANAADKIDPEEFSAQLWTWAMAMADLLENRQDQKTNPALAEVRKELRRTTNTLSRLSVEARIRISEQLSGISELTNKRVSTEAGQDAATNIHLVDQVTAAAHQAANACYDPKIKDGPKNRRQDVRRVATKELGLAWRLLTDKKPTRQVRGPDHFERGKSYSKFQEFVIAALKPLFGGDEASSGIDAIIKDVIADMEKTPSPEETRFFHM